MANTYLSRTQGTGNRQKFTYSAWIKRGALAEGFLFQGYTSTSSFVHIKFDGNNKLQVFGKTGGSDQMDLVTSRVFRDTGAFYHVIVAIDTTQSTDTNRVKVYINGVQETSFSTTSYPSVNANLEINVSGYTNYIGAQYGSQAYYGGLMSYVAHIDGTQELPTIFGETDATTGEWKIKTSITPSVAWGTNGFLILKDGNSLTDQSSNSNNFTLGGGTLTNTEDCPSNVFATLNPLYFASADTTFANGNNTVNYNTDSSRSAFGTLGMTSGKYYFEVKIVSDSNNKGAYGICDTLYNNLNAVGAFIDSSSGYGYFANGQSYNGGTGASFGAAITTGDIVGVALDMDNLKLYFSKNGTWQNSGDPTSGANGTGAAYTVTADRTYLPAIRVRNGTKGAFNFGNGSFEATAVASAGTNASGNGIFEYDTPTGYTALSTKGLNL